MIIRRHAKGFTPLKKNIAHRLCADVLFRGNGISRGNKRCNFSCTGFTLIEIAGVVIIISILVVLACASYFKVISKSEDTEALTNLAAIRKAELSKHDESGTFVNASDTEAINDKLPSPEIQDKTFRYKVVNATAENFTAIAERIKGGAEHKPIEIAMYANGGLSQTYVPQGGITSGAGGGYTPDSGGSSGGGGSGTGSGFGLSGGSGSGGASGGSSGSGYGGSSGGSSSDGGSSGGSSGSGGGVGEAASSGTGDFNGLAAYSDVKLNGALAILQGTVNGDYFYNLINEKNITLSYGDLSSFNALGLYIPTFWLDFYPDDKVIANAIYMDSSVTSDISWSKEAIAVVLVHESLHADYDHNTEKWVIPTMERYGVDRSQLSWFEDPVTHQEVLGDSIDQEYNAFVQEALLWREIRGQQTNQELDYILNLYEQDEALGTGQLYTQIAQAYQGYPPY